MVAEGSAAAVEPFDYRKLGLKGPAAEFELYAQQKVAVAQKLGLTEDVEVYLAAFELGRDLLSDRSGGKS